MRDSRIPKNKKVGITDLLLKYLAAINSWRLRVAAQLCLF
ncbi:hypothetical protein C943_02653 [Mariniradius saccharolyticus AK6]|uniref:Uncharacterized protein n=1 Tax=Mariniradius saccharolyticus AK6 TaxID=1239962 RepID=M7X0M8_9BACT|nr:hypothetical protein C943_02653 [Mariniradius saccharolyticus AK6]